MKIVRTVTFLVTVTAVLATAAAYAQDTAAVRRAFEAGQHQQVIEAASEDAQPGVVFLAAQSQQKLGAVDAARELYGRLAARPDDDPWHFIGVSATQLLDNDQDAALASAQQATMMAGELPEGHYQVGLVLARRQDWRPAGESFDRAAQLDPSNAYASYYAGLMHYRSNRTDLMAVRFERFLKQAPDAPERPEVLQIMRTIRGR
jgi:tetratricopeptide (TPR) repeat protein